MITPVVADLYHGNPVDFAKIAASGIWGVIHKARQGIPITDVSYSGRMEEAKAAGLLWAAYDFGVNDDIATDAAQFVAFARLSDADGAWLDFERNPQSQMTGDQAYEFIDRVAQKLGRACGIYGGDQIRAQIKPDDPKWIDMAVGLIALAVPLYRADAGRQ